ncbi:hypothetical protein [Ancylobacter mangrovi]|uniref:hypothetical protein n=1 Tax=Ancylobacter mangrovi TaxID=2972472 RepID=UPI002162DABA|nr:hypothetical protein [Ancylobacter mangrovi]MCS0504866.1 hypothetical protein [Ancylobacter mangrovi]
MFTKRFILASAYNLFLNLINLLLSISTFILLARILAPTERAHLAAIIASVGLSASFSSVGMPLMFSQIRQNTVNPRDFVRAAVLMVLAGIVATFLYYVFHDDVGIVGLVFLTAVSSVVVDTVNKFENFRASYFNSMIMNYFYTGIIIALLLYIYLAGIGGTVVVYGIYTSAGLLVLALATMQFLHRRVRRGAPAVHLKLFSVGQLLMWLLSFASVFSRYVYILFFLSRVETAVIGVFLTICGLFSPVSVFTVAIGRAFYGGAAGHVTRGFVLKLAAMIVGGTGVALFIVYQLRFLILDLSCLILPASYCGPAQYVSLAFVYVIGTTTSQIAVDIASRYSRHGQFIMASGVLAALAAGICLWVGSLQQAVLVTYGFSFFQLVAVAFSLREPEPEPELAGHAEPVA